MWSKRREQYTRLCHKCGKNISAGEERFVRNAGDIISYFYHLDCGESEFRKYQTSVKDKVDKCLSELRQLWDDLEPKVKSEDLEVKDVKRIYALKKKINKLLKTKGIEDFDLTYWEVEMDFANLKKYLADLDNFIKENASPRTVDITNKGKYSKTRECHHEKGIEPCTDDPTFFCCSYCWDTNSPEFLKGLIRWQINDINKLLDRHNASKIEFAKISSNYSKLLGNNFSNQEELKQVYQQTEKDLHSFLKGKGININNSNHIRERERERAKLQQDITNLENKPNKTPTEEQELENKRKQLEDLDKPSSSKNKNNPSPTSNSSRYFLWITGGSFLLFLLVFIIFRIRKKRNF